MHPALQSVAKKATRLAVLKPLFFLPRERKIALERWLRGREQYRKLRRTDCVVVSFGKSGRTWLRVMLSRFYQVRHGLSQRQLIGFDNLSRKNSEIPTIFFTHDNYLMDYTGNRDSKRDYYGRKVVLLVRNPADVAVSQYFQWQHRMKPGKKDLNDYPGHGEEVAIGDFVLERQAGLSKVIDFMNLWAEEIPKLDSDLLIVRYEDMRAEPEAALARILAFIDTPGSTDEIREAVAFSSFENMRKLEEKKSFWLSGGRMVPKDRNNVDSFKTRRGKVGGYRDYFSAEELSHIDSVIRSQLSPTFGYERDDAAPRGAEA